MKTNKKIGFVIVIVAALVAGFLLLSGCPVGPIDPPSGDDSSSEDSDDTGDGDNDGSNSTPPPENMMGTLALDDGSAAVMDIQFGPSGSSAGYEGSDVSAAATINVSGKVRYGGEDYTVTGTYDDETAEVSLTAVNSANNKFIVNGTYTVEDGFSGTVDYYDTDGSTVLTSGSVSAAGVDTADTNTVKMYTGTFSGDGYGTWNGTLTADSFYGSYAGADGYGFPVSGTFNVQRSGNTVSYSDNPTNGLKAVGGKISADEESISGWYQYAWNDGVDSGIDSGSWSGTSVDTDYDPVDPDSSLDLDILANVGLQTFENAVNGFDNSVDWDSDGTLTENGDGTGYKVHTIGSVTATIYLSNGPAFNFNEFDYIVYELNSYSDQQTGIGLDGQIYVEPTLIVSGEVEKLNLLIDSDVSDGSADDSGLTITYPGGGSSSLLVDAEIDWSTESINAYQSGSPLYELDASDVLSVVDDLYFNYFY